jgi:hypothetical protein
MSAYHDGHDDGLPRFEPWLGIMASAFIPVLIALFVHPRFLMPLIVATVGLFVAGLVMLRRQTIRRRLDRASRKPPDRRSVARSFDGEPREMEGAEP